MYRKNKRNKREYHFPRNFVGNFIFWVNLVRRIRVGMQLLYKNCNEVYFDRIYLQFYATFSITFKM